ncbi:MAG: AAA domain-containing protein [Halobacteria archaeon]|nr:AAA domain-containing protein [Halobacteria archaeon]
MSEGETPDGDTAVEVEGERLCLRGDWSETAGVAEEGDEILVTDVARDGRGGYTTTTDSYVVVEPDYLVNVTDIRSWVECPRLYYLNKLTGVPLKYEVIRGTVVHRVFGDLLRGVDLEDAVEDRVEEVGLELGLLGRDAGEVKREVEEHARGIESWLEQTALVDDSWRSEKTLLSEKFGIKGRSDAVRRGTPVELKTGKNSSGDARFKDKVQAASYCLLLREKGREVDSATVLYTRNAARNEPVARDFRVTKGLLDFVVRTRNEIAAAEKRNKSPTGETSNLRCSSCFEQDTCMVVSGKLDQESKAGKIGEPLPENERDYFEEVTSFIEKERQSVHDEFAKLWRQSPEERAEDDRALVDLKPVGKSEVGGKWELRAERLSDGVSKIREGDTVLASDGDPIRGDAEIGRVERLGEEVVVTTDEPVDLRRIDVYPSEINVDRLLNSLHDFVLKSEPRKKKVFLGDADPGFDDSWEEYVPNNERQNEAVNLGVNARDLAVIHGPPGTGKTYTIAHLVRALVRDGQRVLVSALTNRAVDNVLEAVEEQGYDGFVRFGTESGVTDSMTEYRVEHRGDPDERAEELLRADVVGATTSSCSSRVMREQEFDVAVVDEASQLTEPETLAAVSLAEKFVLVGDHHQLPPVTADGAPSAFERLTETYPEATVMLDRQYRMSQRIQAYSSREFYDGGLYPAHREVAAQSPEDIDGVDPGSLPDEIQSPVSFVNVEGEQEGNTNTEEADKVARIVDGLLDAGVDGSDIGVIAPFRAQVAAIKPRVDGSVAVDTVDRFQGSSKEVVVVSFVATGSLESPVFDDYRRLNVALTRAKKSLVLVGDESALRDDGLYSRMVEWADRSYSD